MPVWGCLSPPGGNRPHKGCPSCGQAEPPPAPSCSGAAAVGRGDGSWPTAPASCQALRNLFGKRFPRRKGDGLSLPSSPLDSAQLQGSLHGCQETPVPTHKPAHGWHPLMPTQLRTPRSLDQGDGGAVQDPRGEMLGQTPLYLAHRMAGGTPVGSQPPLQPLCPPQVLAPVAQAGAERSRLCKGQVPSPLHNSVLAPQRRGGQGCTLRAEVTGLVRCQQGGCPGIFQ